MKKVIMEIQGMHCASCASNVEKSLSKTQGVKNARVNMIAKKGYADIEDSVSEEDLRKAVRRAGYNIAKINYE